MVIGGGLCHCIFKHQVSLVLWDWVLCHPSCPSYFQASARHFQWSHCSPSLTALWGQRSRFLVCCALPQSFSCLSHPIFYSPKGTWHFQVLCSLFHCHTFRFFLHQEGLLALLIPARTFLVFVSSDIFWRFVGQIFFLLVSVVLCIKLVLELIIWWYSILFSYFLFLLDFKK